MVRLKTITEENFNAIINMKRPESEGYVASNAISLAQAWLYRDAGDVYPFAVYNDDEPVGFMMLDEDLEDRSLVFWRILFPEENAGKGYGSEAMRRVIELARLSGKYDNLYLNCAPDNARALHVYEKLGFRPTGERERGEIVFKLDLARIGAPQAEGGAD